MPFTWTFDAPTGTYKNFALSSELFEAAVENSVFMDHVQTVPGFGKKMGETVTLTRVKNITEPLDASLEEQMRIPEDDFQLSTRSITVKELGRAIPYTNLALDLSSYDLENPIQRKLREQMRLVLDTKAATAFKTSLLKYATTGTLAAPTFTLTTNGSLTTATRSMKIFDIENIRDALFDTYQTPPLEGGDYLGIFRTAGLRAIKTDTKWEEWHKYTDPQAKFNGEVGRIESVRLIETNHARALNIGLGTGTTEGKLAEGVIFGDESVAIAEAMTPELRAAIPGDFGRSKAVAWYGILEFASIWDTANPGEAKIIHVTSA